MIVLVAVYHQAYYLLASLRLVHLQPLTLKGLFTTRLHQDGSAGGIQA
ncbi:MAG: hypothetical protein RM338_20805 [Nostoc sp. DedQUE12a]|nr:hypothetical protein [Nostoc sp. DedQUE12a]